MTRRHNQVALTVGIVLLLSLGISLTTFAVRGNNRAYRTLFFPARALSRSSTGVLLSAERRRVPAHRDLRLNASQLVQELLLGPARPEHDRLVLSGTRLISVVESGRDLYVNLTSDMLFAPGPVPAELQIEGIATNLSYNFPRVKRTFILLDGQAPDFSALTGDPRYDFSAGVPSRLDLLR